MNTYEQKYTYCPIKIISWVIAVIISGVIWYNIFYYSYRAWQLIQEDKKLEFRYSPKLKDKEKFNI